MLQLQLTKKSLQTKACFKTLNNSILTKKKNLQTIIPSHIHHIVIWLYSGTSTFFFLYQSRLIHVLSPQPMCSHVT